jgi:Co/Zn/Cd efflux system component
VNWQRSPPPTGQSGDTTSTAPMSAPAAAPRRQRYRTIGLTAVGALAIAVHVWLGGAALAAWRWTSLAADIVLAVVVVKLIAVTAVALRHLAARRSSDSQPPQMRARRTRRIPRLAISARSSASCGKREGGTP